MKKAFVILAHQLPEQLNIFTNQILSDKESHAFIHINKLCEDIIPKINSGERVHISKNNVAIHWGSDEILTAILNLLRDVLTSNIVFDCVFICTGQDLLVRTDIDAYLSKYPNKVIIQELKAERDFYDRYVRGRLLYKWPEIYRRKYDFRYHPFKILRALHYRITLKGWPIMKKKVKYDTTGMTFYKDWFWCALPIDIVNYIISFVDNNPEYMSMYEGAFIPEEGFITTLLKNHNLGDRIVNMSTTFIKPMVKDHPPILTIEDVEKIEESGCLFARKFDIRIDKEIVEYFRNKFNR